MTRQVLDIFQRNPLDEQSVIVVTRNESGDKRDDNWTSRIRRLTIRLMLAADISRSVSWPVRRMAERNSGAVFSAW